MNKNLTLDFREIWNNVIAIIINTKAIKMLKTAHIILRPFKINDFFNLYRLNTEPKVLKFINGGTPLTAEQVRMQLSGIIENYAHHPQLGVWAAELAASRQFMGWYCLKPLADLADIEVGYRLLPDFWGKGLATEGTSCLVDYGFHTVKLAVIVAITHPENIASQRVLTKAGLVYQGEMVNPYPSHEVIPQVCRYVITAASYRQSKAQLSD